MSLYHCIMYSFLLRHVSCDIIQQVIADIDNEIRLQKMLLEILFLSCEVKVLDFQTSGLTRRPEKVV